MNIGDTVYWLGGSNQCICSGTVQMMSTRNHPNGGPAAIVVDYDGMPHLRSANNSWDEWFPTKADAYREGIRRLTKTITDANQTMLALIDSMNAEGKDTP